MVPGARLRGGEEDVRVAFVGPLLGCAGSVLDRGGQVQRGEAALQALRLPVGPELLSVLLGVFAALAKACRLGGAGFFRYESGGSGGMTTDAEVTYETKTVR